MNLLLKLTLEFGCVNVAAPWGLVNLLQLTRKVRSHLDVFGFDFLFKLEHQLQELAILVLLHANRLVLSVIEIRELNGQLGVDLALKLCLDGLCLCFELVLVRKLLGDAVKVDQNLLEGLVVGVLELVEPVVKRVSYVL